MADKPVENKAEAPKAVDVLAAAAGAPTPAQAKGLWALVRQSRKLALLLGGFGVAGAAGGYGYKYFTATPPKANAQADPPAVAAKPEEPKPGDTLQDIKLPDLPAKSDAPAVPEVKVPVVKMPEVTAPAVKPPTDKSETEPPPVLPPTPPDQPKKSAADELPAIAPPPVDIKVAGDDKKKADDKVKAPTIPDINPADAAKKKTADEVTEPAIPTITLPDVGKKKPAPEGADPFKATDKVPTDDRLGPASLPMDVTDKNDKKPDNPVIRVQGTDPAKIDVPPAPKVEVPKVPMPDKKGEAADPMIPKIDINLPPPPDPGKKDDKKKDDVPAIAPPPPPGTTVDPPPINIPGPKPDVPPVSVGPTNDSPGVKVPEKKTSDIPTITIPGACGPAKPPASADPMIPPTDVKSDVPLVAPVKKDSYDETWHEDHGEPYAAISREYYHDPKYAAALEAYNKGRRDKIIRVPPPWVLEEKFAHLVGRDKPESKPKDNGGLKFEPVSPAPSSGRPAPPATETSRPTDEYRVTRESGETIREVAQKVLGDGAAWKKLYDLNPNIDPTLPLPAGTILRLK
jgi:hypothetical protein